MTAVGYKALCHRVHKLYRKSLNLLYVDSCELAGDVYSGQFTEARMFELLDMAVKDEPTRGDNHALITL